MTGREVQIVDDGLVAEADACISHAGPDTAAQDLRIVTDGDAGLGVCKGIGADDCNITAKDTGLADELAAEDQQTAGICRGIVASDLHNDIAAHGTQILDILVGMGRTAGDLAAVHIHGGSVANKDTPAGSICFVTDDLHILIHLQNSILRCTADGNNRIGSVSAGGYTVHCAVGAAVQIDRADGIDGKTAVVLITGHIGTYCTLHQAFTHHIQTARSAVIDKGSGGGGNGLTVQVQAHLCAAIDQIVPGDTVSLVGIQVVVVMVAVALCKVGFGHRCPSLDAVIAGSHTGRAGGTDDPVSICQGLKVHLHCVIVDALITDINIDVQHSGDAEIIVSNGDLGRAVAGELQLALCPVGGIGGVGAAGSAALGGRRYGNLHLTLLDLILHTGDSCKQGAEGQGCASGVGLLHTGCSSELFKGAAVVAVGDCDVVFLTETFQTLAGNAPAVAGEQLPEFTVDALLIFLEHRLTVDGLLAGICVVPHSTVYEVVAGGLSVTVVIGAVILGFHNNIVIATACGNGEGFAHQRCDGVALNGLDLLQAAHLMVVGVGGQRVGDQLTVVVIVPGVELNGTAGGCDAVHLGIYMTVDGLVLADGADDHTGITVSIILIVCTDVVVNVDLGGNMAVVKADACVLGIVGAALSAGGIVLTHQTAAGHVP